MAIKDAAVLEVYFLAGYCINTASTLPCTAAKVLQHLLKFLASQTLERMTILVLTADKVVIKCIKHGQSGASGSDETRGVPWCCTVHPSSTTWCVIQRRFAQHGCHVSRVSSVPDGIR